MAEILITGGAGNLGRILARELRTSGHTLRLLDLPGRNFSFCDTWDDVKALPGNILDIDFLKPALAGVDWVFHLAAVLPPVSEENRDRTFKVNVDGTRLLFEACQAAGGSPGVVFASSISVYGDTSMEKDPISPGHPVRPIDIYAESKVEAEKLLMASGLPWINLRVSAIAIPEFLDPPEPWPFQPGQRIELVALGDLIRALVALPEADGAMNQTLIISGGPAWQTTGEQYVRRWGEIMDIPFDEMSFLDRPGWLSWYDTSDSQALLSYQATSLDAFFEELRAAVDEALL